jgi:hypothetical protein
MVVVLVPRVLGAGSILGGQHIFSRFFYFSTLKP